jgi:hypothetical protein
VPEALGKALKTLGKVFVECRTRQRGLGTQCIGKAFFAEYFSRALGKVVYRVPESTRQRKAVVTAPGDGDGVFAECLPDSTRQRIRQRGPHVRYFAECLVRHSAKSASLPSARAITLGKEPILVSSSWFFAECHGSDTRQSDQYTPFLFVFPIPSKQTKDISQISHIYIRDHHRHI